MKQYLILNNFAKGFQKVSFEELEKELFNENSLNICIECTTDTDGIIRPCNFGYYDTNKKSIKNSIVKIGNVTIENISLKCYERKETDYSSYPFLNTRADDYIIWDFLIQLKTACPNFKHKLECFYDDFHNAYYYSGYRYDSYSREITNFADKLGAKEYSYVDSYEYNEQSLFDAWHEPLLNRLVKDIKILNLALETGLYPKELDLFRYHSDFDLDDNEILSEILSNIRIEDNFVVFPVELHKIYTSEILSLVFEGKVYSNYKEDSIYCSIPSSLKNKSSSDILQELKTDIFFEYITNYSYKKTKILRIITHKKYKELVSQEVSDKIYKSKKNSLWDQKRNIVDFLMSITCCDIVEGYSRVGRDDMEETTQRIVFYSSIYEPNKYCINIISKMLGHTFEYKDNYLVWEEYNSEYVAGLASDRDTSLYFLKEQLKSITDYFTYKILNSDNSDWEKPFYD